MHELMLRTAPNVHARDAVGRTALHFAAGYGYDEAALELLRRGAHVDAADRFGATPLHWRASRRTRRSSSSCSQRMPTLR